MFLKLPPPLEVRYPDLKQDIIKLLATSEDKAFSPVIFTS